MAATKTTRKADDSKVISLSDPKALVPPKHVFDDYVSRDIVPGVSDFDMMEVAHNEGRNVLLYGPTGPGKTSFVAAYAAKNGLPFYPVPANGSASVEQLLGQWRPTEDPNRYAWQDGPVTTIARLGGVLYLTEVNFFHPKIAVGLNGLLDKRRHIVLMDHEGEIVQAHPKLLVVADYNPDYEGTRPLNEAFRNRFAIQIHWDYSPEVEAQLVGVPSLLTVANQLRTAHNNGDLDTPVSTNMLMEFEDIAASKLGFPFAVMNFLNRFQEDEKVAVRQVLIMHRDRILSDMGIDDADILTE